MERQIKKIQTNSHCETNKHTTSTAKRVFGGTSYITSELASHRVEQNGEDTTQLGRWTWVVFTGRQGIKTRIITGYYRPVKDTSNRAGSVYSQHEKYFKDNKEAKEPRQAILDDLEPLVTQWQDTGELLIIGLDLNDNSWDSDEARQIESWELVNTLKERHPDLPQVATCDKNTQNKPTNGIWCSPGLEILQAGMTSFGSPDVESADHRMLWIDISVNTIFGYRPSILAPIQQAGIPMQNPEIGNKFNAALQKARNKHNIPNQFSGSNIAPQQDCSIKMMRLSTNTLLSSTMN
jgi:hypothetical protein